MEVVLEAVVLGRCCESQSIEEAVLGADALWRRCIVIALWKLASAVCSYCLGMLKTCRVKEGNRMILINWLRKNWVSWELTCNPYKQFNIHWRNCK